MLASHIRVPMAASGLREVLDQGFLHAELAGAARRRAAPRADRRPVAVRHRGRPPNAVGVPALPPLHQSVHDGGRRRWTERRGLRRARCHRSPSRRLPKHGRTSRSTSRRGSMVTPISLQNFEAIGSLDGRYFDQDRFTPIHGRLPDPTRADEVAVNEESARRYGYHVGQKIDFATVSANDVESAQSPDELNELQPPPAHPLDDRRCRCLHRRGQRRTTPTASPLVLFTPAYVKAAKGLETLRVARPRAPQRRRRRRRGQADHHRAIGRRRPRSSGSPRPTPSTR